jgi:hypothetical protein
VHARQLQRGRDVDGDDLRVRVWRPDEVDVALVVAADVVDEDALALEQPPVLLTRQRLALVAAELELDRPRLGGAHALRPAAWMASTMPTYPVQRQMLPWMAFRTSASVGLGLRARSAFALINMPGVQ